MSDFPHVTPYVNAFFSQEKQRADYIFLRPLLMVLYFAIRMVAFPLKFVFHRRPLGYEKKLIDSLLAFGIKHLASQEALELLVRHVQIEPLLYRYLLSGTLERRSSTGARMQGIDGEFSVDTIDDVVAHGITLCHDDLSYELMQRFDKDAFLHNLEYYRHSCPEHIEQWSSSILETNRRHSLQVLGCTNVVIIIVMTITIVADLHTALRALNSFDSDSILLWALKNIYAHDPQAMASLDFYLPANSNRSHYNSSVFLADPHEYLYYHIAFDEFVYALLHSNPNQLPQERAEAVEVVA